jgi:hypothetical protein
VVGTTYIACFDSETIWEIELLPTSKYFGGTLRFKRVNRGGFVFLGLEIPVNVADIKVCIYTPETASDSPYPLIMYYHGGGWCVGDLDSEMLAAEIPASCATRSSSV